MTARGAGLPVGVSGFRFLLLLVRGIEAVVRCAGYLAAWLFVLIGGMIVYEVLMRYVFIAPTIWVEEISRLLLIWSAFLAMPYLLQRRGFLRIEAFVVHFPPALRRFAEGAGLLLIIGFASTMVYEGVSMVQASVRIGRASDTMLALPQWWGEAAVPTGFALLLLQAVFSLWRLLAAGRKR